MQLLVTCHFGKCLPRVMAQAGPLQVPHSMGGPPRWGTETMKVSAVSWLVSAFAVWQSQMNTAGSSGLHWKLSMSAPLKPKSAGVSWLEPGGHIVVESWPKNDMRLPQSKIPIVKTKRPPKQRVSLKNKSLQCKNDSN